MSDDQGWGDVGYNGHPLLKTPHLDAMAREGVRLDRFYAAVPVCSPTRGSCLTGRHPSRYNINWASEGYLPAGEVTLAEALRDAGYQTGHFGKWHLGQLSRTLRQGRKNKLDPARYSPPWDNGFTTCVSTEGNVPTYRPYFYSNAAEKYDLILQQEAETVGIEYRWSENYWTGPGRFVDEMIEGDDAKFLMDRALDFIRGSKGRPFFACIWFHTPHAPVAAGREWRRLYADLSQDQQHYYGAISAMDVQIGRLRSELRQLGRAGDTVVFFCSDNGPTYAHPQGSAGPFRGRKASLLEGGIRVPAIVEWPKGLVGGRTVGVPLSTSDYYPTILALAGARVAKQPFVDGEDIRAILAGTSGKRARPIFFHSPLKNENDPWARADAYQAAVQTARHKLLSLDSGQTWALYELLDDPKEEKDLAAAQGALVSELRGRLDKWRESCVASAQGVDYR
jgi:arylsulfatase A-like enzyme